MSKSIRVLFKQIPDKIVQHYLKKKIGKSWEPQTNNFTNRSYKKYEDYVEHQKAKLTLRNICSIDLLDYDKKYFNILSERINESGMIKGGNVLCLGARLGTEVKSFIASGCFAVGIDLNPGDDNYYVLPGDFHKTIFAESSIDVVFTNAIDHAFDIDLLVTEVMRILKFGGLFIIEVSKGKNEGGSVGFYESLSWTSVDELVNYFLQKGFNVASRQEIDFPFPGESIYFCLADRQIAEA